VYWAGWLSGAGAGLALLAGLTWLALAGTAAAAARAEAVSTPLSTPIFLIINFSSRETKCGKASSLMTPH
jgi:hypothetical protein